MQSIDLAGKDSRCSVNRPGLSIKQRRLRNDGTKREREAFSRVVIDATAAHGTKKFETERLEQLCIPIPPFDKQMAFSNQVELIESIQSQQSAASLKAQATFDTMLAQTFNS